MGTSVFDQIWDDDPPKKKLQKSGKKLGAPKAPPPADSFDALWNEELSPEAQRVARREQVRLDIRARPDLTRALPYDREGWGGDSEAAREALLAMPLLAAQAIPGAERFEALAGQLGSQFTDRPLSYQESRDALRSVTDPIPTPIKMAVQVPGMLKTAALLPFTPAKAGMAIGAADQLLSADDMTPGQRGRRTLVGVGVGGAMGRVADVGQVGARTLRAPNTAKTLARLDEARAASSGPLYDKALKTEGAAAVASGGFATPKVQALFKRPEVAEIAAGLKQLDEFQNVALESPAMLDAVYKVLSDRKGQLARQLDAVTVGRPNLGRFDKRSVEATQRAILDAMESPGVMTRPAITMDVPGTSVTTPARHLDVPGVETAPSPRPSLREAIADFENKKSVAMQRNEGTYDQRRLREILERRGAEASRPRLSGEPLGPRRVEIAPEATIETSPMRVELVPAESYFATAPMPSYRSAVEDFAKGSARVRAAERGHDAIRSRLNRNLPMAKSLKKTSPESFEDFIGRLNTPEERAAAELGVLGATRSAFGQSVRKSGIPAVTEASRLLRIAKSPHQKAVDRALRALLLGTAAEVP